MGVLLDKETNLKCVGLLLTRLNANIVLKLKNLCHERLQTSFSKSGSLSVRGYGHPQNDAKPNFFPDSTSSISGLPAEISFTFKFYQEGC